MDFDNFGQVLGMYHASTPNPDITSGFAYAGCDARSAQAPDDLMPRKHYHLYHQHKAVPGLHIGERHARSSVYSQLTSARVLPH
jgi:hypothetical protein